MSVDWPIVHKFKRMIKPGDPRKVFPTKIVVSYQDKNALSFQVEAGIHANPNPTASIWD